MASSTQDLIGRMDYSPPVIIPMNKESPSENKTANIQARASSPTARFRFPALPLSEPGNSTASLLRIHWPECSDTETAWACAEAAEKMVRQFLSAQSIVLGITSAGDGDGKTSATIALAPQIVKIASRNTLVVDANFAKPDLSTKAFAAWKSAARPQPSTYPTDLPNLNILPSANALGIDAADASHSDKITSRRSMSYPPQAERFQIDELRKNWPLVLIDMPSLVHPYAVDLASCCDGVYLVVRIGHTVRRAVIEAQKVIVGAPAKLLGCLAIG